MTTICDRCAKRLDTQDIKVKCQYCSDVFCSVKCTASMGEFYEQTFICHICDFGDTDDESGYESEHS